jgi:hypothetical protein
MKIMSVEVCSRVVGSNAFIVKFREVASTETFTRQESTVNGNWHG